MVSQFGCRESAGRVPSRAKIRQRLDDLSQAAFNLAQSTLVRGKGGEEFRSAGRRPRSWKAPAKKNRTAEPEAPFPLLPCSAAQTAAESLWRSCSKRVTAECPSCPNSEEWSCCWDHHCSCPRNSPNRGCSLRP